MAYPATVASGDTGHVSDHNRMRDAIRAVPRLGPLRVASSALPIEVKDAADFVCDGVDDQAQINEALRQASRPGDGFGGDGYGCVELVGPDFSVADDNTTTITMYPSTTLRGMGRSTLIRPRWTSGSVDRGGIELLNAQTHGVTVKNLSIGRTNAAVFNGHGIKFTQSGNGQAYEIPTGNDPFNRISGVDVFKASRKGIWLTGTAGGSRESQVDDCVLWACLEECFIVDGSSDSQISNIRVQGGGSDFPGATIGGGNTKVADSKSYYSEGSGAGWLISSSRCEIADCAAQDSGGYGFDFQGQSVLASGIVADSNSRMSNTGGVRVAADGLYSGIHCFDRDQTPASRQMTGVVFSGSRQVYLTGRTSVPSGGTHVSGSPAANSYVRVVRDGSTLYTAG